MRGLGTTREALIRALDVDWLAQVAAALASQHEVGREGGREGRGWRGGRALTDPGLAWPGLAWRG
jgi:hypothetical protein